LKAKQVEKLYSRHKTASTNDGLPEILKMKYWNRIPEMTISAFADSNFFFFKCDRPTKLFYDELRSFSTFFALNFNKKLVVE
jgi:hypothetical protein